jgi:cytochrome b subunit of formate dehydrogenase
VSVALAAAAAAAAAQGAPQDCGRCHDSREFLLQAASRRDLGTVGANLVVTRGHLTGGPHERQACASCHRGVQTYPHDPVAARTIECRRCHARADSLWRGGVHGPRSPDSAAASCVACHGGHDIERRGFLPTAAGRALMRRACVQCHEQPVASAARDVHADSIACTNCHGSHDMRPVPDHATRFIDVRLARACTQCHAGVAGTYWSDSHGRTAQAQAAGTAPLGPQPAATCVSCHGEHGIRRHDDPAWRFAVADACIECHEAYGATFRDSYHGQASTVGSVKAAECADCHTAHDVRPSHDSASSVAPGHRLATCRACHDAATARFAGYLPHADVRDRGKYPGLFWVWAFMSTVLFGTMVVWGTHTLLWYRRSWRDRKAHGPHHRGPVAMDAALRGAGPLVWRFGLVFRIVHALIVATFFVLVLTGLPLRFSCAAWAPGLARLLGGVPAAGLIHRVAGVVVFGYFALYAAHVTLRLFRTRDLKGAVQGRDSIVFGMRDLRDIVAMVKWFLHRGPPPRFGRYSYMEKFDYFAELWGVGVIGFTGLMLWQPELFSRVFPGVAFNVAIIVHSYEAMIATAFIFTIHFFNVHLRPDKFPLDAVMFHGRATLQYMEEEHPELADRLRFAILGQPVSARPVADAPAPPPSPLVSRIAALSGLALLGIGLALIGLILWGSLC